MKKAEKILLLVLLALLICRMLGVPLATELFALWCLVLALIYSIWGYRLLWASPSPSRWIAIAPGFALAAGLVALPFLTYAVQIAMLQWFPVPNAILLLALVAALVLGRMRKSRTKVERLLLARSSTLFVVLGFLAYMPPNAAYRAVIIALNTGREELIANMHMIAEGKACEAAFERGDCAAALAHAERSNRAGQVWLFGPDGVNVDMSGSVSMQLEPGKHLDLMAITQAMVAQQRRAQLWKIGRTFNNLYEAHRCLGEQAEADGDPELAYHHFFVGDSLFNAYDPPEGQIRPGRVWSLVDVARMASLIGDADRSDSLFRAAVDLYETLHDSLDVEAAPILHAWATANADRQWWRRANKLERLAIAFASEDTTTAGNRDRWLAYRLQLAKNFLSCDSLPLAERLLERTHTTPRDSARVCQFHLVRGSLRYWQSKYRASREDYLACLDCFAALGATPLDMAVAHRALGYAETALAAYADAREQVTNGQQFLAKVGKESSNSSIALLQLSANIHQLQGHYIEARQEYERCITMAGQRADDFPGVLTGLADVLIDLAELENAKLLADRAVDLAHDSLSPLQPGQCAAFITSAKVDHHLGDQTGAERAFAMVLKVHQEYLATDRTDYMHALNGQGLVALAQGRPALADSLLNAARVLSERIFGSEHPFTTNIMLHQALLRMEQRRLDEASALLRLALPITQRSLGNDHDQLADIQAALGDVAVRKGDREAALVHHTEALRIYRACFPPNHPKLLIMESRVP